jgi:peroxiredoxin
MKRIALSFLLAACGGAAQDSATETTPTTTATATATASASAAASTSPGTPGVAQIGRPAPDFALKDVNGKPFTLSQYKGKTVVLEWFNPGCPFVTRNHEKGPLKDMAARVQQTGIVWLTINSNGPGTEGNGIDNNKAGIARLHIVNPVLIDEDGKVGHAFGARTTPHMFVIDAIGNLVYRGAIDNAQDGETTGGATFQNYVESALADVAQNHAVRTPETQSYGCSVKYR